MNLKKTLLLLLFLPLITKAQTGNFTIYPAYEHNGNNDWIIQEIAAGRTKSDYIIIENLTESGQEIKLETVKAEETPENTFNVIDNEKDELANWIKLESEQIALNPKEKRQIRIEITIPKNAQHKTYKGAILASQTKEGQNNMNIQTRIGIRTYITVTAQNQNPEKIFLFTLSLIALIAAIIYNLLPIIEKRKK